MRIPSGTTDQYIYFVAVDSTDYVTRETGLSSFTVRRSRNGGASAAMTTPTINETDSSNMPGVYELLLDEDMTIDSGNDSEELCFHITHTGMAPVTRTIELYRPKITAGNTLDVTSTGAAGIDWGNVENQSTSVNLSSTTTNLVNTTTTNTDMRGTDSAALASNYTAARAGYLDNINGHTAQTGDNYARLGAPAGASIAADIATIDTVVDAAATSIESSEIKALVESQRNRHTVQGNVYFVDPVNGDTHANGNRGGPSDPYASIQDCHDNAVTDSNHDCIILVSGAAAGVTTHTEDVSLSKRYLQVRGPGRDFICVANSNTDTFTITGDGISLEGFRVQTTGAGSGKGVQATGADFVGLSGIWFENTRGDAATLTNCSNALIKNCNLQSAGQSGAGDGISIIAGSGQTSSYCRVINNLIENTAGDGIVIDTTGGGTITSTTVQGNFLFGNDDGINIVDSGVADTVVCDNRFANNTRDYVNASTTATYTNNEDIIDAIYLDTVNGSDGDPGIPSQPVQTIARAKTLADDLSKTIYVISGSSITLGDDMSGYTFNGHGWTLALGGQSISGAQVNGATVSGTGTGATRPEFVDCVIGTTTLPPAKLLRCGLTTTLTAGSGSGSFELVDCYSDVAGTSAPTIDLNSVGNVNLDMTRWSRGLTLSGLAATDTATVNGVINTLTLNGADATVNVSGQYGTLTNNLTGSPTVSTTNAFKTGDVASILTDTGTTLPATLTTIEGKVDTVDTVVDNNATAIAALNDISAADILTTALTESYASDGATGTLSQLLYMIHANVSEFEISGTTKTVRQLDGSTTAMTYTLDDATNPTSITRAT